ncbi:hypothetical protein FS842_009284 [Serendipita sp. 407]|nr:hypothetical protein FRC15_004265 [Serendipita sp. 397]KAG9052759.1 hypothetical protein FS842_009284 [Serendipita sp. 407]
MAATIPRRVAAAMERIAPLRLAEKWDNVGLLIGLTQDKFCLPSSASANGPRSDVDQT